MNNSNSVNSYAPFLLTFIVFLLVVQIASAEPINFTQMGQAKTICVDDSFEENEERSTAAPIDYGTTYSNLIFCGTNPEEEYDYYIVTVPANTSASVEVLFSHNTGDLDAVVYQSNDVFVDVSLSNTDNEYIVFTNDSANNEDYIIGVAGDDEDVPYVLTISTVVVCIDDSFEENDNNSDATSVTIGNSPYTGLVSCQGDNDFYSFTLPSNEAVQVDLKFLHVESDLNLRVFTPTKGSSSSRSQTDNERATFQNFGDTPTVVYIEVENDGASSADYSLSLTNVAPCIDDEFEDNENFIAAPITTAGSPYKNLVHCLYDHDFYKITVPAGESRQLETSFVHSEASNLDVRIFTDGELFANELVASGTSTTDNETIVWQNQSSADKEYKIQVTNSGDKNINVPYEIAVSAVTPCADDGYEQNDWVIEATPITVDGALPTGLIRCPADDDAFSITLPSQNTITVDLLFDHSVTNLDLVVFAYGTGLWEQIERATTNTDNEQIVFTNNGTANQSYVITVYSDESIQSVSYSLDVSEGNLAATSNVFLPILGR